MHCNFVAICGTVALTSSHKIMLFLLQLNYKRRVVVGKLCWKFEVSSIFFRLMWDVLGRRYGQWRNKGGNQAPAQNLKISCKIYRIW
jgi:hypothetical protein